LRKTDEFFNVIGLLYLDLIRESSKGNLAGIG